VNERIDLGNPLSCAHWCGCFSCSDQEPVEAIRAADSDDVGAVGLYLATRYALESFDASDLRR